MTSKQERLYARPYDYGTTDADDPRGHEVELALAPELAPGQVAGLEGVGGEPGDVVHDADVGREQDREGGYVEEVLEPDPYLLAERYRLFLYELYAPWISVGSFAKDRGDQHGEADERQQPNGDEGQELLPSATFHQPSQRRKFSSFTSNEYPVAGLASSSPVIGETMRGIWTPMPMPLSLM